MIALWGCDSCFAEPWAVWRQVKREVISNGIQPGVGKFCISFVVSGLSKEDCIVSFLLSIEIQFDRLSNAKAAKAEPAASINETSSGRSSFWESEWHFGLNLLGGLQRLLKGAARSPVPIFANCGRSARPGDTSLGSPSDACARSFFASPGLRTRARHLCVVASDSGPRSKHRAEASWAVIGPALSRARAAIDLHSSKQMGCPSRVRITRILFCGATVCS